MDTKFELANLEILKMARDLVINEYTDRRAEMHNKWLIESDHLWQTQKLRLSYPSIPPYPTEHEILARAQVLLDFIKTNQTLAAAQETKLVESKVTVVPKSVEEVKQKEAVATVAEKVSVQPETQRVLPNVIERLGKMRTEMSL